MPQDPNSFIGKEIADRYEVRSLLGEGGFAWVFRAKNVFQKNVAVKVLHSSNANALARFRREIEVLKALPSNPHVPRYIDDGVTEDGHPFLVLEYVEGRSLVDEMRRHEVFEPREAVKIVFDLCQALHGLHQFGVAHRDIKPENVMLAQRGGIKLIDFGLVRDAQGILRLLEQEGHIEQNPVFAVDIDRLKVAGTPEYMAPEQFSDALESGDSAPRTDTWSDVFSLGVILFELITTNVPFPMKQGLSRKGFTARLARYIKWRLEITDDDIPKSEAIDPALESILHKTLRSDPRQRQPNAQMLRRDLGRYLRTGQGVSRSYGAHTVEMRLDASDAFKQTSSAILAERDQPSPEESRPQEVPSRRPHKLPATPARLEETPDGEVESRSERGSAPSIDEITDRLRSWDEDVATSGVEEREQTIPRGNTSSARKTSTDITRPIYIISDGNADSSSSGVSVQAVRHPAMPFIEAKTEIDDRGEHRAAATDLLEATPDAIESGDSKRSTLLDLPQIDPELVSADPEERNDTEDLRQTQELIPKSIEIAMDDEELASFLEEETPTNDAQRLELGADLGNEGVVADDESLGNDEPGTGN